MAFPFQRLRRLRATPTLRDMVRETALAPTDFIYPMFVRTGKGVKAEIASMPGQYQLSVDHAIRMARKVHKLGVPGIILFGIPDEKDPIGASGTGTDSIVCRAVTRIKNAVPELCVITDVCLCEYTDHGHCGIVSRDPVRESFTVDNDATLGRLAEMAVSHAHAGADMVAPSDMMDGRIGAVRDALDEAGCEETPIMAYAAKFASAFYGPFRDAAESPPQFGDRKSYQMDPANAREALREVALDIDEGADIVMVKPALPYLDIIRQVRDTFQYPTAAYNVSGEFAMVKAAAANGWVDERAITLELLTSIKRAGADLILTYHAIEAAQWLA